MLKGTQDGRRISLSVRQKHPLHARSTGGIGNLKVGMVWRWRSGLKCVVGFNFDIRSPIPAVPE